MNRFIVFVIVFSVLLFAASGLLYGSIFYDAVYYDVNDSPWALCCNDFDGNGYIDIAVANDSGNISILFGVGNGTFSTPVIYSTNAGAYSICSDDFNQDENPDLAVANRYFDEVSVLIGAGDGTFASAVTYNVGYDPTSVCSGDFDGDGDIDLAVTNEYSNDLSVLLGVGDGSFLSSANYGTGYYPFSITKGDFNEDGHLDLAVVNIGYEYGGNISVLIGIGNGSFNPDENYNAGDEPWDICTGDFNEDNHVDLAVANENSDNVSILFGAGDGTFGLTINYDVDDGPYSICVGDFNEDGHEDLAIANQTSANITILLGAGDGTFRFHSNYNTGVLPHAVIVKDFNQDELVDLAVANYHSGNVSIFINYENEVATLLKDYSACQTEEGIKLSWSLSDLKYKAKFNVYKKLSGNKQFDPFLVNITENGCYSYSLLDKDCKSEGLYIYKVDIIENGNSQTLFTTRPVGITKASFELYQNSPNPFNPITTIRYNISKRAHVKLEIFNVLGEKVCSLVNKVQSTGEHVITWDGSDKNGNLIPSGLYYYKLEVGKRVSSRKMVLLR